MEYELRRRIPASEQCNTYVGMHLSNEDVHKSSQLSPHKHDSSSDGSRCLAGVHQVYLIISRYENIMLNDKYLFRAVLEDIVET